MEESMNMQTMHVKFGEQVTRHTKICTTRLIYLWKILLMFMERQREVLSLVGSTTVYSNPSLALNL